MGGIMKTKAITTIFTLLAIIVSITSCVPATPTPTTTGESPTMTVEHTPTPDNPPTPTPATLPTPLPDVELAPFPAGASSPFSEVDLVSWTPQPYGGTDYSLPIDLSQVVNPQTIAGLTDEQIALLVQNGFVVIHSQEEQFSTIRESVRGQGQPYFLTIDAALHSLHLTFDELLKALERQQLQPLMVSVIRATLDEVEQSFPAIEGTSIEEDSLMAIAYLSVALKLFDPQAQIDSRVEADVTAQIEQIMAGEGRACSVVLPSFEDDYGAYKPVGHYAGDTELERYFRGMTWLGRVHLKLGDQAGSGNCPPPTDISRVPLIVTLALRRAQIDGRSAADVWADIHDVLTFAVGPSDDGGPAEYASLMDQIYGTSVAPTDLADDDLWNEFLQNSEDIPVPRINSTFVDWVTEDMPAEIGWRFMGQRFTLDGYILQNLVFDVVKAAPDGEQRLLPSGLDVMAVLGSDAALDQLVGQGETRYPNYLDQINLLQEGVQAQPEQEWLSRFYDSWLYVFSEILEANGPSFPSYMQTNAWAYREMNTALGSWAELKHDTVLYAKMPEASGGGGPPTSPPAPGYVEANPNAFYRMAYVAASLVDGLEARMMASGFGESGSSGLSTLVLRMETLAEEFLALGDIAAKELAGVPLDESEYQLILRGALSPYEYRHNEEEPDPPPIVAAVAGSGPQTDEVLEVATGYIDRIYLVVPIDGELLVAQGGVYSYFEFAQPRSARLTDEEWRERLVGSEAPQTPVWASNFALPGGEPTHYLAFRIGDIYFVNDAGEGVNIRDTPSLSSIVLSGLSQTYFEIIDGPIESDGYTWWQVEVWYPEITGWLVEDQEWYDRSY
jgi:hypothetical protein